MEIYKESTEVKQSAQFPSLLEHCSSCSHLEVNLVFILRMIDTELVVPQLLSVPSQDLPQKGYLVCGLLAVRQERSGYFSIPLPPKWQNSLRGGAVS